MPKISLTDIFFSHGSWSLKFIKFLDFIFGTAISLIVFKSIRTPIPNHVRRILIIRPGGIGDAVFLLPILRILKDNHIQIEILCEPRNQEVFTSQGYVTYSYLRLDTWWRVLTHSYDVVVDTEQWHYLTAILSYCVKTSYRIGFATRALRAKLFNKQVMYGTNDYELDNFLRLFEGLLPFDYKRIHVNHSFDISGKLKTWASQQVPTKSIAVFLGASIAIRRFSKKQILDIVHIILTKGYSPVLLGGRDVVWCANEVLRENGAQRIYNFVGKVSLTESAALIQRCQSFIGMDSGGAHLASAVGTPVLSVFGPGNVHKWQMRGEHHEVLTNNSSCSPCTKFGYTVPSCQGSYHCLKELDLQKRVSLFIN
ncbi:MAG: glycosyltransferase family 9 protein [Candidatus Omnitrophica bacterium]|nr:glycosyltransferase family 9 protein [Candidatus Omnitrophota bacterium]